MSRAPRAFPPPRRPHGACGEQHARARITWAIVRQIRADAAEGCKIQHIAWWHGVNPGTVFKIVHNQQWIVSIHAPEGATPAGDTPEPQEHET